LQGQVPSGLTAALAAGRAGARVIIADEDFLLGGRLLEEEHTISGMSGLEWVQKVKR
jgi:sarcosine oxidase subunit alpha